MLAGPDIALLPAAALRQLPDSPFSVTTARPLVSQPFTMANNNIRKLIYGGFNAVDAPLRHPVRRSKLLTDCHLYSHVTSQRLRCEAVSDAPQARFALPGSQPERARPDRQAFSERQASMN